MVGTTTPKRELEVTKATKSLRENQLGPVLLIQLISSILIQKPAPWHTLSITLCLVFSFLSIELYGQIIKLLPGRVLKMPPSEPWMAMRRPGVGSWGLPHVMDV